MKLINNCYEVIELLSKDVCGQIYRVFNRKLKRYEKLKILDNKVLNDQEIKDFMQFFVVFKTIIHPNIVSVYEFENIRIVDDKSFLISKYFYTFEDFDLDKKQILNYMDFNRLEAQNAIYEITRAIQYLHFRDISYVYLNFENIVFYCDGNGGLRVKLNDLGHNFQYKYIKKYSSDEVSKFLSPKFIWEKDVTVNADLYSIGHIFYYVYYGYDYKQVSLMVNLLEENPVHNIIKKLVTDLEDINSYKNINQFVDDLKNIIRWPYDFSDKKYYEALYFDNKLVGRDYHISEILEIANSVLSLKAEENAVVIQGERGVGKSRLIHELNGYFKLAGYRVFDMTEEQVKDEPFDIFKKIISEVALDEIPDFRTIKKYGVEIATIIPEIGKKWNVVEKVDLSDESNYLRIANRIYQFVKEYVCRQKIVISIDNLRLVNVYDLKVLRYLINFDNNLPFFVLTSIHSDNDRRHLLNNNFNHKKVVVLPLTNYKYTDVFDFVKGAMGDVADDYVRFINYVMMTTDGNPHEIIKTIKKLLNGNKIYVDSSRRWNFSRIKSLKDFENREELNSSSLEKLVSDLSYVEVRILLFLSVCYVSVDAACIASALELEGLINDSVLENLIDMRIIGVETLKDKKVYHLRNKTLKGLFTSVLSYEDVDEFSDFIINYLREQYKNNSNILDEKFVYTFSVNGKYVEAVKYGYENIKKLKERSFNVNQISTALAEILSNLEKCDDEKLKLSMYFNIAKEYFDLERYTEAIENYNKILDKRNNLGTLNISHEILCTNEIAKCYICVKNNDEAFKIISQNILLSREYGLKDRERESLLLAGEYYINIREFGKTITMVNEYIEKSNILDTDSFVGLLFNLKAICYFELEEYEEAKKFFEKACMILEIENNEKIMYEIFNYLGEIECEYFGNFKKALNYFQMSEDLRLKNKIVRNVSRVRANMAAAYFRNGEYRRALKIYDTAIQMAFDSKEPSDVIFVTKKAIVDYIIYGEYEKAHILIKKLDIDYQATVSKNEFYSVYVIIKIIFLTAIGNWSRANQWYIKLKSSEDKKIFDTISWKLLYTLFEEQKFHRDKDEPNKLLEALYDLKHEVVFVRDYQLIRAFIFVLGFEALANNNYSLIHKALKLDESLVPYFDMSIFRFRRDILLGIFRENRIDYYEKLLASETVHDNFTTCWICHKILADEYRGINSYYNEMLHYTAAINCLRILFSSIPDYLSSDFILKDSLKMQLRARWAIGFNKIVNIKSVDKLISATPEINDATQFFDMSNLGMLFRNNKFRNEVYEELFRNFDRLDTLEILIKSLNKDSRENIKQILLYCMQLTAAGYGRIVFDDNSVVDEVFEIGYTESGDIDIIKNSLFYVTEGVLITVNDETMYEYLLEKRRRAIIFIPIFEQKKKDSYANEEFYRQQIGYLYLESNKTLNNFNKETFDKCVNINGLINSLLEMYRLETLSTIDRLTGAYLRKYTEELFYDKLISARVNDLEISVVMCDIDKFKSINDTYGHAKGDEVLKAIADILIKSVSDIGFVGRYGGEEFLIILPDVSSSEAFNIIERVRKKIEKEVKIAVDRSITVSFGIATYPDAGLVKDELIENADRALYYSKNNGRNQVTVWADTISGVNYPFSKLFGIFSGNTSIDIAKMQSVMQSIAFLNTNFGTKEERITNMLGNIIDITKAECAYVVEVINGQSEVYWKCKDIEAKRRRYSANEDIVDKYFGAKEGSYFVNWEEYSKEEETNYLPRWNSIIAIPISKYGEARAVLIVEVSILKKEFELSDYQHASLIADLISVVL